MIYSIIYADPPWSFHNKNTGGTMISGASAQYPVMSVKDIKRLPVATLAADDCALFMWWVASQPQEALDVVRAWGFTLKTMTGFTWVKQTKHGLPFFGMGFYTRQGSENCLVAVRGKPQRVSASVRAVVCAPAGRHSEKPPIFRERIVELMGDVPRLELFARERVPGWAVWGNEVVNDVDLGVATAVPRRMSDER